MALGGGSVDPAAFTAIRIGNGALFLWLLSMRDRAGRKDRDGMRGSGIWLFAYAIAFSFAYVSLPVAAGALILFAAVQVTIIAGALISGERLRLLDWLGLCLAIGGLVYLTLPGLSSPAPGGSVLMAIAGIAWGVYTLRGRGSRSPLHDTARNFMRATPLTLLVVLLWYRRVHVSPTGAGYAVASGVIASGLGYVIWYAALRGLTATRAAMVQLSVPVIAAVGAALFLSESISPRLIVSACLILGGIGLTLARRRR